MENVDSILLDPMERVKHIKSSDFHQKLTVYLEQLELEWVFFYSWYSLTYTTIDSVPLSNNIIKQHKHILTLVQFKLLYWFKNKQINGKNSPIYCFKVNKIETSQTKGAQMTRSINRFIIRVLESYWEEINE